MLEESKAIDTLVSLRCTRRIGDMSFAELPHESAIPLHPFKIDTPQSELDDLKALLAATRLPTKTFENVQTKDNFGVTRKWIVEAKDTWLNSFDW